MCVSMPAGAAPVLGTRSVLASLGAGAGGREQHSPAGSYQEKHSGSRRPKFKVLIA